MGTRVTDMPGASVPVSVSEQEWPEAERGPVEERQERLAPFGYGLAAGSWRITEVHVVAEPWPEVAWRLNPVTGAEEGVQPYGVSLCREWLGRVTGAPRREMLEELCPGCVRRAAEMGAFLPR